MLHEEIFYSDFREILFSKYEQINILGFIVKNLDGRQKK